MKYYSTNKQAPMASLRKAVVKGLVADKGPFVPVTTKPLPQEFYDTIDTLSFQEIAYRIADTFFDEDTPTDTLKQVIYGTLSLDVLLVKVADNIYSLELFHGPTLTFRDVGGRFMAYLLGYFIKKEGQKDVNVLVAASGDMGSAVANGLLSVEDIHAYVLYSRGKISEIQERQPATLGQNITALGVNGTFDGCRTLVEAASMDRELNKHLSLASANFISVARLLLQAFYYLYTHAQLKRAGKVDSAVICVPNGNFGNITAGLFGKKMGLPARRFITTNDCNNIFYRYLQTGEYNPRPPVAAIASTIGVGNPGNFARVSDLYGGSHADISAKISGITCTGKQIRGTVKETWKEHRYLFDPHGACGYRALQEGLKQGEVGVFLETTHPTKFLETVESIIGEAVKIPAKLQELMKGEKKSSQMTKKFADFKKYLLPV